nr:hypothetical protein [Candidatus Woesearchaeota archaeon]
MDKTIEDKIEIPICNGCNIDLREKIEWEMDNGQHIFAQRVLGKERLETGEDLIRGMNYCSKCRYEFQNQDKLAIAAYANSYIESK